MTRTEVIWKRFVKGFISGAITAMVLVLGSNKITSFGELTVWLQSLLLACLVGGINGALLAMNKAYNYTE